VEKLISNVDQIYLAALEREAAEDRSAYLDDACAGNPELRRRVQRLLEAQHRVGSFLESPAPEICATVDHPLSERPGTVIGPYKLLQQIGEGGMGVVFMAEQNQPLQRTVALKIIKPGMDTRQVIARFEAERQAMAMMDHPNIAKVLDAGTTDSGRPYFVMELVKGVPITKYCDEKHLPIRDRLQLFVQVCQAVQHAHQKGIIHRDIKPNNVLVAEYDHQTVPKVIDFGVAKATAQKLTERTMFTEFGQVLGTMEYMSPEQSKFNQLDIDTRSDIYSLGVLLYELLAGSTPFEGKRLHEAAFDEMLRIIREEEPPKPSTRLSATNDLPSIAANRGSEPNTLSGLVRGELDWIVMKALDKDRNRRYETASGLAADLQHHLRDEPVLACPPSAPYRLRKFARRNRVALLAASSLVTGLLLLVVGLAVSNRVITVSRNETAEALRQKELALTAAEASAEQAETQRRRAEESFLKARVAVRDLLMSPVLGRGEWTQLPVSLRRAFADKAAAYYAGLLQEDRTDPSLRYDTAVGQRSLGLLYVQTGDVKRSEELLRQSIAMLEELHREFPQNAGYRQQLAWSHYMLFRPLWGTRRESEAQVVAQRAVDLYEGLMAERPGVADFANEAMFVYYGMGSLLRGVGESDDAERMFQRAIAMHEQQAERIIEPFMRQEIAKVYFALAEMRIEARQMEAAADMYSRGLKANSDDPRGWYQAAALYLYVGDVERYRGACREMLDRFEELAADDPRLAALTAKACALAPDSVSDFSRIERLAERSVTGTEKHPRRRNFILLTGLTDYRGGRHDEAIDSLERFAPKPDGVHIDATAFAALAMAHHRLGQADQARASLDSAHTIIAKKPPDAMRGADWAHWLHCEILFREAEGLLGTASPQETDKNTGQEK
jgi:serine/threonine protein kinase/tetratricopeptide (TPR) repeat protein